MEKMKRLLLLTLCCLILCQTTVNTIPTNDGIEICGNYNSPKED